MRYTKGPWGVEWYVCKEKGKELWRVPKRIGPVSVEHNHWAGYHLDIEKEDAQLISAAPDLLEALVEMAETFSTSESGEIQRRLAIKDAKAAINKALGKT